MNKAIKFCSGLFLASALLLGCSIKYENTTTDANGNTTTVVETTEDGKTTTTTSHGYKRDVTFYNKTDLTFEQLAYKTNLDEDYTDLFDDETLEPGYQLDFEDINFDENIKTMDFVVENEDGYEAVLEGLDVSNIKDLDKVNFVFTQDGDTISVGLSK